MFIAFKVDAGTKARRHAHGIDAAVFSMDASLHTP